MANNENSNTEKNIQQNMTNVDVSGNISNSAGVIIGSNIHVEGGINVTNVIQEIESFGLNFLTPDYFQLNKSSQQDFANWKKGFRFELPSIMEGKNFNRYDLIQKIVTKLDDNNGDHALLLLGKSGTSKSNLLMDIICHYFKNGFIVFHNFDVEEIKDVFKLNNSLRNRLKDDNKILVAVDDVHDKRFAPIFSVIDSLRSYVEKKDNIRFILTGRLPEFDRYINERLGEIPSESIRNSIRKLSPKLRFDIPNFDPKEIKEFIKKYKDEDEARYSLIQKNNIRSDEYDKIFNDEEKVDNISLLIFKETEAGYPILVKFLLFGKGLYEDMSNRYHSYLANDNNIMKLHTMLICSILERANIPITSDLLTAMKIITYAKELKNQTLIFSEIEKKWKTLHVKWNLELLTFLYSENDESLLGKRIEILKQSLQLLMTTINKEENQFLIIGSLYDSTTIDTEQKKYLPINIIDQVVRENEKSYIDNLSKHWRFSIYNNYIAKNYYYLKQYQESLNAIEKIFNIYPNDPTLILNKGVSLSGLGEEEKAIACFNQVIDEIDPTNVNAWLNKGISLDKLGRYEEALKCYDEIITKLDPTNVNAWFNKGLVLHKLGRYKEALKCYDEIITKLDPTNVNAWYSKGRALYKLGRYEEALKCYDEIITKLDPTNVGAWLNKGLALDSLGQYEEALKCYDEIITKLDPTNVGAWLNKGAALDSLGQYEEAIKCYDEIITKLDPTDLSSLYNKGLTLNKLSRYPEAIDCYDKVLEIDSNFKYVLDSKGYTLINLSKYEEAIEYFNKALSIDPKFVDAIEHKKIAEEKMGNGSK
jgi:tetratricopeptide (TPR) repeat protein